MATASILHADLDSFYASVEQRDRPELRGRPVVVGGGVVLAASYQAKAFGVRTAMGGRQARRLCPHAVVVAPRFEAYQQASNDVFAVFRDTTPLVEGISIDEAFLDVGGLARIAGTPRDIAARLRRRVAEQVGLPITVGVARTKFLAKVASRVAKPDGLLVVEPDDELAFLSPLPVEVIWGIGKVTAAKLRDRGIATVAQLAEVDERALQSMLGRASGRSLHALSHNRDPRRIETGRRRRSIGSQRALGSRYVPPRELDDSVVALVDRVCRRLRRARRVGRTVVLRLRFDDFTRATRSHTLPFPTAETVLILTAVRGLLRDAMPRIRTDGVTLVGVAVANLADEDPLQLELPFPERGRVSGRALDRSVDDVRDRFGAAALTRAALLRHDPGMTVPLLPD
jgi:DNA polymerase-4